MMCYQVCFRLGHNASLETFAKLQQAYGTVFCQGPRFFGGFKAFQKEESQLKMNLAAEGPPSFKTAENVVRVRDLVRSDRRLTVRMDGES
ncbi:hypothetical protein TNCV_3101081 [Trichonephila clavipes]|nr:hypothetical protein TNCV_3101081 [Trichonephila clavipes]